MKKWECNLEFAKRYVSEKALQELLSYLSKDPVTHKDTHPNVRYRLLYNWFINSTLLGIPLQRRLSEKKGFNVPHFILVDPTSACNLRCEGCWAGAYAMHDELEYERLDSLCSEAKELGIYWIVMSGGEPFLYPRLFDLAAKHSDMAFMLYTNGTRIDDRVADRIVEVGNHPVQNMTALDQFV